MTPASPQQPTGSIGSAASTLTVTQTGKLEADPILYSSAKVETFCKFLLKNAKNDEVKKPIREFLVNRDLSVLSSIKFLDLSSSHLKEIPQEIEILTGLIKINLENNQLADLPATIVKLQNLVWLNLDGNKLTSVPACLSSMQSLKCLQVYNNPIREIPSNFISKIIELPYSARFA